MYVQKVHSYYIHMHTTGTDGPAQGPIRIWLY